MEKDKQEIPRKGEPYNLAGELIPGIMEHRANHFIHGLHNHALYGVWIGMKTRCYNKNSIGYKNWGGRGIGICNEWRNDFKAFYNWAITHGWEKELYIDRERNNEDYSPENCRFVTCIVNNRNKRNNVYITYKGEKKSIIEWAEKLSLPSRLLYKRLRTLKWSVDRAFTLPNQGFGYNQIPRNNRYTNHEH